MNELNNKKVTITVAIIFIITKVFIEAELTPNNEANSHDPAYNDDKPNYLGDDFISKSLVIITTITIFTYIYKVNRKLTTKISDINKII